MHVNFLIEIYCCTRTTPFLRWLLVVIAIPLIVMVSAGYIYVNVFGFEVYPLKEMILLMLMLLLLLLLKSNVSNCYRFCCFLIKVYIIKLNMRFNTKHPLLSLFILFFFNSINLCSSLSLSLALRLLTLISLCWL